MSSAEFYFDETTTEGARSVFAVAGGVFSKENVIKQSNAWRSMLERWALPYFHMTDCANGNGAYANLTATERDKAAREAIAIIRDTISAFLYVTVEVSVFDAEIGPLRYFGGPYEWCAFSAVQAASMWCEANPDMNSVHYYFESGANGQANAAYRIKEMMEADEIKKACCFGGVSFVRKETSPAVQAADLIVWHAGKDAKRAFAGQERRKDFLAIIDGIPALGGHFHAPMLRSIVEDVQDAATELGLPLEMLPELEALGRRIQKRKRTR